MSKKKILTLSVIVLLGIQFFQIDKGPFDIIKEDTFQQVQQPPTAIQAALEAACYDCHSYQTKYPWYTYVAPVSWWINGHIKNGRKAMNFSTWGDYSIDDQKHLLYECKEEIAEGHMPPKGYVRMHGEADLSEETQTALISWLEKNSK